MVVLVMLVVSLLLLRSCSGKSSLLNVLAGRVPAAKQNTLEGVVEVGETPLDHFDTQVISKQHCSLEPCNRCQKQR